MEDFLLSSEEKCKLTELYEKKDNYVVANRFINFFKFMFIYVSEFFGSIISSVGDAFCCQYFFFFLINANRHLEIL
ncbi:hypothetical protein BSQ83_07130 [Enterococcus faecium]|nr:hypothetical protein BSQ81_07215 [Enterococcus faecium]OLZ06256.1 hypothetical protein BSQ83_07130 [Enterococcus faecium]